MSLMRSQKLQIRQKVIKLLEEKVGKMQKITQLVRNMENYVHIDNIYAENGHVSGNKKTTATTAWGSARRSARRSQSFCPKLFQLLLFRTNQTLAITHKEWKNINEQKCKR